MRTGLVAGFGAPVGAIDLDRIAAWGFDCIRQDVHLGTDPTPLVREFVGRPLVPIFLVRFPDIARVVPIALAQLGQRFALELYDPRDVNSEPNGLVDPHDFGASVQAGWAIARTLGFTGDIISGGISNIDQGALTWLAQMIPLVPGEVIVGVHRYSPGGRSWSDAHFDSRDEEWFRLATVLGHRLYALTEFGYDGAVHTVPWFKSWFGLFGSDWQRSDAEVGLDITQEFAYWKARGALYCCLYQFRDGRSASAIDHYGIVRADGTAKPAIVNAVKQWTGK